MLEIYLNGVLYGNRIRCSLVSGEERTMNEMLYFTVGSLLFYTVWYLSLGWFISDRSQRQASLHFWIRDTKIQDLPRETYGQKGKPVRRVAYLRLVLAVFTCSILFYVASNFPLAPESRTIVLLALAVVTPIISVWVTYRQLLIRYIPLAWGILVGFTATLIFMKKTSPWGLDPKQELVKLMGSHDPRTIVVTSLFGIIAFLAGIMAAAGYSKPANWFAWCIVIMAFGAVLILFGLMAGNII